MADQPAAFDRSKGKNARARTHQAPPADLTGQTRVHTGIVTGPEQHHIKAGVGAILRAERTEGGYTVRELAARIGAAHTTILRLEAGTRRPSAAMLASLARVLSEGHADYEAELYARLADAAGASLVTPTDGGQRRRDRRMWRVEQERRREAARQARRQRARRAPRSGSAAADADKRTHRLLAVLTSAFDQYERVAEAIASGRLTGRQLAAAEADYERARARLDALLPTGPNQTPEGEAR